MGGGIADTMLLVISLMKIKTEMFLNEDNVNNSLNEICEIRWIFYSLNLAPVGLFDVKWLFALIMTRWQVTI